MRNSLSDGFDDAIDHEDAVDVGLAATTEGSNPPMEVDADGYMSCDSGEEAVDIHQDDEEFNKQWDSENNSWYYVSATTGESFWAVASAEEWMEVPDKESQVSYHRHSITGETKWSEEESVEPLTVWEELKDPITQEHYYYSNTNKSSQWSVPKWLDLVDPHSGTVYYFNAETNESVWELPEDFVDVAVDDSQEEYLLDPMGESQPRSFSAVPTPRTTPAPHFKTWLNENSEPSKRPATDQIEVSVSYSLSKRPRAVRAVNGQKAVCATTERRETGSAAWLNERPPPLQLGPTLTPDSSLPMAEDEMLSMTHTEEGNPTPPNSSKGDSRVMPPPPPPMEQPPLSSSASSSAATG